jgi:hypothetical protein
MNIIDAGKIKNGALKVHGAVIQTGVSYGEEAIKKGNFQMEIITELGPFTFKGNLSAKELEYFTSGKKLRLNFEIDPMPRAYVDDRATKKKKKRKRK